MSNAQCGTSGTGGAQCERTQRARLTAHELALIAPQNVQDQARISLGRRVGRIPCLIAEVELRLSGEELEAWHLAHHLEVDGLARLDAQHELVVVGLGAWALEERVRGLAELDADLRLAFVESLTAL